MAALLSLAFGTYWCMFRLSCLFPKSPSSVLEPARTSFVVVPPCRLVRSSHQARAGVKHCRRRSDTPPRCGKHDGLHWSHLTAAPEEGASAQSNACRRRLEGTHAGDSRRRREGEGGWRILRGSCPSGILFGAGAHTSMRRCPRRLFKAHHQMSSLWWTSSPAWERWERGRSAFSIERITATSILKRTHAVERRGSGEVLGWEGLRMVVVLVLVAALQKARAVPRLTSALLSVSPSRKLSSSFTFVLTQTQ